MYEKPVAPQSVGAVLDSGYRLFGASLKHSWLLALLGAIFSNLPYILVPWQLEQAAAGTLTAPLLVISILGGVIGAFFYAALVWRVDAVANARPFHMGSDLRRALGRLLWLLLGALLYALATALGLLLLVVPGLIIMVSASLLMYAVVVDGMGPVAAFSYSHRLVWGSWWRTALLLTVIAINVAVLYVLVGVVTGAAMLFSPNPVAQGLVMQGVLAVVAGTFVAPFTIAMGLSIYYELKLRREGSDLERRIEGG